MRRLALVLAALAIASDVRADAAIPIVLLDGAGAPIDPVRGALLPTQRIPNDETLPRGDAWDGVADPRDVRIEVRGDAREASIESVAPDGTVRDVLPRVPLTAGPGGARSPYLRLVTSEIDRAAPGVTDRLLRVALGDRVRVSAGGATAEVPVGRPPGEEGPRAIRTGRLRIRIVRNAPAGPPPIGTDDAGALALAREQVVIANEIWAQCAIGFGDPLAVDVAIVDPPITSSISIGDTDGLPAAGGGTIRLRASGRAIRPIATRPGARPLLTALDLAAAIRALGLRARVFENERAESGVERSADVIVRDRAGAPVAIDADGDAPLSTDPRQRIALGEVELGDGLTEFDNVIALTGTLEERALVRAIADDDPSTIDVLVVADFAGRTREGEAFLEGESAGAPGSIVNVVILSREGIARARTAFTIAHELGHVLLDLPLHPDHLGPDRPWLLMDSNTSDGSILGPLRLRDEDCRRARSRSASPARPAPLR